MSSCPAPMLCRMIASLPRAADPEIQLESVVLSRAPTRSLASTVLMLMEGSGTFLTRLACAGVREQSAAGCRPEYVNSLLAISKKCSYRV
jgi:hypothetical protein